MNRAWLPELLALAVLLVIALIIGWTAGDVGLWLFIAVALYLVWQLVNLHRVEHWLRRGRRFSAPRAWGVWRILIEEIYQRRRRERERKREFTQLLREIRESTAAMPDGVVLMNHLGEIRWLNQTAGRLLQLRVLQDVGQRLPNLVRHPDFIRYLNGRNYAEPVEFALPSERGLHLSLRIVPYGEDQQLLLVRDSTRLHRLEQMRREFVANASHELRSPLTVMSGYLESMSEDAALRAVWAKPLQAMRQQTTRMTAIVSDLLELSRLETEPREAAYASVDVASLARRIREAALSLGQGPADITLEIDGDLQLLGAERELYSAFSNLVFNAMKYTPADGRVSVSWAADADGAAFAVSDTGIGIPAAHIPRLTERFYRVNKSRDRDSGGTGLGLAIVKHVLQHHGARLKIESEPGRGSRFTCRFSPERVARRGEQSASG
ncbi:MAG: phosphate regulon sensor histidine kinase PhoR [Gammaproteobacteria bacterium]|nr:phosphate regulon sensor histidine kinase PhoR [Gammaproteobacteria bacterium]